MNRNETNRFATNPINLDISRSTFNRDHKVLFSFNVGDVIPFYIDEVLPGDTFSVDTAKVVRMQPLVTPIMDNVYLDTYYFYCPTRLVWEHWKQFNGENTESAWTPSVEYSIPQTVIPSGGYDEGTIADYLGVPIRVGPGQKISSLPFRVYAKVMDDWFRDENLMDPVHVSTGDEDTQGQNSSDQVSDVEKGGAPFIACKYFDYFTACLPGAQKAAGPSVEFALRGLLPVDAYQSKVTPAFQPGSESGSGEYDYSTYHPMYFKAVGSGGEWNNLSGKHVLEVNNGYTNVNSATSTSTQWNVAPSNLFADLNNTSVFDINELRTAFAIQRFYEKQARGGSRYIEYIKTFFNVDSPDARLQRSEYLGGNRLPLNVGSVEQTSATEVGLTPQGNLTGLSETGDVHSDFTKSFTEHGYILGVCVARYHHTYQQGIERHWLRKTLFDFYNPTFANLGEQGVKTWEIYFDHATAGDLTKTFVSKDSIFGYQEAWADYRYKPSRVAGEMRSAYLEGSLDCWHLADYYTSQPYLGDEWIREDKTMLDRCLAVTSNVSNQLIADFYITCKATRPMPLYSIPGLIDHH